MGEIYKVTNKVNGKVYIGQTLYTTEVRWQGHLNSYYNGVESKLYSAMRKHGVENFIVECVEECDNDQLDEREIYYIAKLDSYHQGYNATLGGSGPRTAEFDGEELLKLWNDGYSQTNISHSLNLSRDTIKAFLLGKGISEQDLYNQGKQLNTRKVCCIDFYSREIAKVYPSITDAAREFGAGNNANINNACLGNVNSAYGYYWRDWSEISEEDQEWMTFSSNLPEPPVERPRVKEEIHTLYLKGLSALDISSELGISRSYVDRVVMATGIRRLSIDHIGGVPAGSRKVVQLESDTRGYIACYHSLAEAADYVANHRDGITISNAIRRGYRAYGYEWEYCACLNCDDCTY